MMKTNNPAQIYLATQRGRSGDLGRQILHTLNFQSYTAEGREPIGPLRAFNEVTLQAGAAWPITPNGSFTLLLPILGGLELEATIETHFLEPGQAGFFCPTASRTLTVRNLYETEAISFLHLDLAHLDEFHLSENVTTLFDLSQANALNSFLNFGHVRGYLGRFEGRQEGSYAVSATGTALFIYVLQGVFEVANRLLHTGDALSLQYQQSGELEFEALSNDAILLLLDLGVV